MVVVVVVVVPSVLRGLPLLMDVGGLTNTREDGHARSVVGRGPDHAAALGVCTEFHVVVKDHLYRVGGVGVLGLGWTTREHERI